MIDTQLIAKRIRGTRPDGELDKTQMKRKNVVLMKRTIAAALIASCVASAMLADEASDRRLPFARHEEVGARVETGEAGTLRVKFVPGQSNALVRLKPAEGAWNLDEAAAVLVDIRNRGAKPAALIGRFNDSKWTGGLVVVPPGANETLRLNMKREKPPRGFSYRFPHMVWPTRRHALVLEHARSCEDQRADLPADWRPAGG